MSNLVDQLKKVLAEQEQHQETLLQQQREIELQLQMLEPGIAGLKETISNIEASLKSFNQAPSQPAPKASKQKTTSAKPAVKSEPVAKPVEKAKGKTYGLVNWGIKFFKTIYENTSVVSLDEAFARTYGKGWQSGNWTRIVGPGETTQIPYIRLGKFNPEAIKFAQEEFEKLVAAVKGQQYNNAEPSDRMKSLAETYSKDFESFEQRMTQIFESALSAEVVNAAN